MYCTFIMCARARQSRPYKRKYEERARARPRIIYDVLRAQRCRKNTTRLGARKVKQTQIKKKNYYTRDT